VGKNLLSPGAKKKRKNNGADWPMKKLGGSRFWGQKSTSGGEKKLKAKKMSALLLRSTQRGMGNCQENPDWNGAK